ncbi:MAG: alanine--tRNA ligase [Candidatus Njordarchaeales archaeon]
MKISKEELKKLFKRDEYEVLIFKEKGFYRKKCKICGDYFWTVDPNRETCGDVACEGTYRFIEARRWNSAWDIHNTIRKWEDFFVKRGHTILDPYPVVARWREDLEFTIASIVDFQPWVTEGIVDPPANPLVVPQPCLRFGGDFSDIDNIGKTGRHLTSFVMGGQHAFNSDRLKGYWKNTYVRYNFEFMTEILGIPAKELTYKEDVWSGGGNFGPSLETFAYGLEIVNGVFMQYKLTNGSFQPLKLKVLDIGWGLERVSWFMQKTPTIYEATFGPVFDWIIDHVGLNYDIKLLTEYARLSGILDTSSPERFKSSRQHIAEKLGLSLDDLENRLGPLEAIYAILDHTRTLVFAVTDGGIPSNVGGAYNLRVILRRAISLAEKYGFNIDWYELLERHVDYFSKTFVRLLESREVIRDIWKVEYQRYKQTIQKGLNELIRILKKRKPKVIGYEILKELYVNHGIPPESIAEISKQLDIRTEIPPNFYDLIREEKPKEVPSLEEEPIDIKNQIRELFKEELENLPKTHPLYYDDVYMKDFEARVIAHKGSFVVLDKTAFYPTGGGQIHDTGYLIFNSERVKVVDVIKVNDIIFHKLEQNISLAEGTLVRGVLDWERRLAIMRHHTATHILNASARKVLGPHIWQVGADKTSERGRLDISHYRPLTNKELELIEHLANQVVLANRPIIQKVHDRTEAEQKYGFRIYQGGAVPGRLLRIVYIDKWDAEACGGTHLKNTGEVGLIRIIGTKRIHDGVVRLIYVAGERALEHINKERQLLLEASKILKVRPEDLPKTAKRFFEEWKDQKNAIKKLGQIILDNIDLLIPRYMISKDGRKYAIARIDIPHELMIELLRRLKDDLDITVIASTLLGKTTMVLKGNKDLISELENKLKEFNVSCKGTKFGELCNSKKLDASVIIRKVKEILKL